MPQATAITIKPLPPLHPCLQVSSLGICWPLGGGDCVAMVDIFVVMATDVDATVVLLDGKGFFAFSNVSSTSSFSSTFPFSVGIFSSLLSLSTFSFWSSTGTESSDDGVVSESACTSVECGSVCEVVSVVSVVSESVLGSVCEVVSVVSVVSESVWGSVCEVDSVVSVCVYVTVDWEGGGVSVVDGEFSLPTHVIESTATQMYYNIKIWYM